MIKRFNVVSFLACFPAFAHLNNRHAIPLLTILLDEFIIHLNTTWLNSLGTDRRVSPANPDYDTEHVVEIVYKGKFHSILVPSKSASSLVAMFDSNDSTLAKPVFMERAQISFKGVHSLDLWRMMMEFSKGSQTDIELLRAAKNYWVTGLKERGHANPEVSFGFISEWDKLLRNLAIMKKK